MIRFITAGESHGKGLHAIIDGFPSGLKINEEYINKELARRQRGFGRGERMNVENDKIEILAGVRFSYSTGAPLALFIENKDYQNWKFKTKDETKITAPRPGHADLAGIIKYARDDCRDILERASARETAIRCAVGSIAKLFLKEFNIYIISNVIEIGGAERSKHVDLSSKRIQKIIEKSELNCADPKLERKMINKIKEAKLKGDTLGGIFEVVVFNVPVGLGSFIQWDRKLNAKLAHSVMSIQAIKGVEIGAGFESARISGSKFHDEIFYKKGIGFKRPKGNNAGGIEGGMSNGENIVIRAAMKPISTLLKPLKSVCLITKKESKAAYERSDVCAVASASIVAESAVAWTVLDVFLEKFGGDSIREIKRNFNSYLKYVKGL